MMNFLDTYEITGTGTSTPPQPSRPEQSLNEEVSQVIGQLGRFWGGFRRQVSRVQCLLKCEVKLQRYLLEPNCVRVRSKGSWRCCGQTHCRDTPELNR